MADPFEIFNEQNDSDFANYVGGPNPAQINWRFPNEYRFKKPFIAEWFYSPTNTGRVSYKVGDVILASYNNKDGGNPKPFVYTTLSGLGPSIGGRTVWLEIPLDVLENVPLSGSNTKGNYTILYGPKTDKPPEYTPYLLPQRRFDVYKFNRPHKASICTKMGGTGFNPCIEYKDLKFDIGDVLVTGTGNSSTIKGITFINGQAYGGGANGMMVNIPSAFLDKVESSIEASALNKYTKQQEPEVPVNAPKSENKTLTYVGVAVATLLLLNILKK